MRTNIIIFSSLIILCTCNKDNERNDSGIGETIYKQRMREFVIGISQYTKSFDADFLVIPQNGIELVSTNALGTGNPHVEYLNAIDGNGQEDLFYGYDNDDQATPSETTIYLQDLLNISKAFGNTILVTDYCSSENKMSNSYILNNNKGYISFAANHRELDNIPNFPSPIYNENNAVVSNLNQVKNFLYLINPENFATKADFIAAVTSTNYDLLIMDLFFKDGSEFSSSEITQLKNKANGGKRLVISYMSIGEAESYRYYWQPAWNSYKPLWMNSENPNWQGNFKVKYWYTEWQNIIYGNENSYAKKILNANFDGVYLDIIDAFEYYERK